MVAHTHLHLLPETKGNAEKVWQAWSEPREIRKLDKKQLIELADKFKV